MSENRPIRRALLSVSDKSGLIELAHALREAGVEIISTGGTAAALREAGFWVTDVAEVTGFPEMMDGRVKTLHPKIHGAFLAIRSNAAHVASMSEHGIEPIDLVVVNLYPFEKTIDKNGVSLDEAIEKIDIGGPAMIRSAAKNWHDVAVVTDPDAYAGIIAELAANHGSLSLRTRQALAMRAYKRTAEYDSVISGYLATQLGAGDDEQDDSPETSGQPGSLFPATDTISLSKIRDLRYGENPHQKAALYRWRQGCIAGADLLHGKEMSFNNYVDAEAASNLVQDFDELAVAIIKHTNPSGVGIGLTNEKAYRRALSTDPVSAFGGIVAFNRPVDARTAELVIEVFSEVIVAPGYDQKALDVFRSKKNLRILKVSPGDNLNPQTLIEYKQISGGFLVQEGDNHRLAPEDLNFVTRRTPTDSEMRSLTLAWTACKHVKSNAIVFANEYQTLGVGAGQMNRVDSVRIAAIRAERFGLSLTGSALASDAFFPFRDNVDEAAAFGVTAIIQPGGSIKDAESIAAANEHNIAMVFTGIRHFRH
ncbi:MAG: bifunctional phosphoribosylaminoimidazolecarboxamide formyltransferase/IMP cyclohydrolase [Pyrinomonadaceae bacterium]